MPGNRNYYIAAGVMSGTSVDGLDIALCRFELTGGKWSYKIIKAETLSYSGTEWSSRLPAADRLTGYELMELHRDFGHFTGESLRVFLADAEERPDLIASHGHTVFHRPEKQLTLQIGDGAVIAALTGIKTVSDFRRLDVAMGGQGAPLVPAGDELLFGGYGFCLNLGGFANISFSRGGKRNAFDVCPVNIVLNSLAGQMGRSYDVNGGFASRGNIDDQLLYDLENLDFYLLRGPRSLGREWVDEFVFPIIDRCDCRTEDKLRTFCEHIALRIAATVKSNVSGTGEASSVLITGGGARNGFLGELISGKITPVETVIPDDDLVDFKEALIFAFLGVLRLRGEINSLASVTGAASDNSGGIIYK